LDLLTLYFDNQNSKNIFKLANQTKNIKIFKIYITTLKLIKLYIWDLYPININYHILNDNLVSLS